jgi:3'(2'), 5'-bisphosphate nucleotidase
MLSISSHDDLARELGEIARRAGGAILAAQAAGAAHRLKPDGSPCTDADLAAEAVILQELARLYPGTPVIAEESGMLGEPDGAFFLVDPLDGTRDFIAGAAQYTVNIALIEGNAPVAGAIYAPGLARLWIGGKTARTATAAPEGDVSDWQECQTRPAPVDGLVALASLRHGDPSTEAFLAGLSIAERRSASSSLKFCLIAQGEADIYPRFGPTMEWDTAAGDAILRAAGGVVTNPDGTPFAYGKKQSGFVNGAFVAWGDPSRAARA